MSPLKFYFHGGNIVSNLEIQLKLAEYIINKSLFADKRLQKIKKVGNICVIVFTLISS